jgi:hypothetical protein
MLKELLWLSAQPNCESEVLHLTFVKIASNNSKEATGVTGKLLGSAPG